MSATDERATPAAGRVLTPPAPPSPDTTEADFMALVIGYARALGYEVFHPWRSDNSDAGWPDLVIAGRGRILFVELKTARGRLSPPQCRWAHAIVEAGGVWRCWRPCESDWAEMQEMLS